MSAIRIGAAAHVEPMAAALQALPDLAAQMQVLMKKAGLQ